jgi:hypothetical protein
MRKILTTVEFEISTTIRFKPNDAAAVDGESVALAKPEVKADVRVRRAGRGAEAQAPNAAEPEGEPSEDRRYERRKSREEK